MLCTNFESTKLYKQKNTHPILRVVLRVFQLESFLYVAFLIFYDHLKVNFHCGLVVYHFLLKATCKNPKRLICENFVTYSRSSAHQQLLLNIVSASKKFPIPFIYSNIYGLYMLYWKNTLLSNHFRPARKVGVVSILKCGSRTNLSSSKIRLNSLVKRCLRWLQG